MNFQTSANTVLNDMVLLAKDAAKEGGRAALELADRAQDMALLAMKIESPLDKLRALESIGHAMKSGLAAIANERARALMGSVFERSLGFAAMILGGLGKLI